MFNAFAEKLHASAHGDDPISGRAKQLARWRRNICKPRLADEVAHEAPEYTVVRFRNRTCPSQTTAEESWLKLHSSRISLWPSLKLSCETTFLRRGCLSWILWKAKLTYRHIHLPGYGRWPLVRNVLGIGRLRDIASLRTNLSLNTVQLSPFMFGQFCE